MGVVTIRPNGVVQAGADYVLGGGTPNAASAWSDNNPATYVALLTGNTGFWFGTVVDMSSASAVVPGGTIIKQIRARVEAINVTALDDFDGSYLLGEFLNQYGVTVGTAFSTQNQGIDDTTAVELAGAWTPIQSFGSAWDIATLDGLQLRVSLITPNSADPTQHAHVYELYVDIEYNYPPTVAVTSPVNASLISVGAPLVQWAYADAEGDIQDSYEVKIFTAAQAAIGGFDPNTSPTTTGSRLRHSAASQWQCPIQLANGAYSVFVRVSQPALGGVVAYSSWAFNTFTVLQLTVAPPVIAPVPPPYTTDREVFLSVLGGTNTLTLDDSSFDTSAGSWGNLGPSFANRTLTVGQFKSGIAGLLIQSTGAGNVGAITTYAGVVVPAPWTLWRARMSVLADRNLTVYLTLSFCDAGGTVLGIYQDIAGTPVNAAGWTDIKGKPAVTPPGTHHILLGVSWAAVAAGEKIYIDECGIQPAQIRNATYDAPNDSFFEVTAGNWFNRANTSLARTVGAGTYWSGVGALSAQALAAGPMRFGYWYPGGPGAVDTFGGRTWRMRALIRADVTARAISLGYDAYDKNGVFISSDDGAVLGNDSAGGFLVFSRSFAVPSNCASIYPYVVIGNAAAGEKHYVDEFLIWEDIDSQTSWGRGGLWAGNVDNPPSPRYECQASYDGGVTYHDMPHVGSSGFNPTALLVNAQQAQSVADYEAPPNVPAQYRARTIADGVGGLLYSVWAYSPAATLMTTSAWLKDPYTDTAIAVTLEEPFDRRYVEPQTTHYPLGRLAAVVVSEGSKGHLFDFNLRTLEAADRVALEALLTCGRPLILVNTLGELWWVKISDGGTATVVKAAPEQGSLYGIRDFYRYSLTAVEVVAPDRG